MDRPRKKYSLRLGLLIIAVAISVFLWGLAPKLSIHLPNRPDNSQVIKAKLWVDGQKGIAPKVQARRASFIPKLFLSYALHVNPTWVFAAGHTFTNPTQLDPFFPPSSAQRAPPFSVAARDHGFGV